MNARRALAAIAIVLGGIAAGDGLKPVATSNTVIAAQIEREEDHVTARELAAWMRERKAGLRVIDLEKQSLGSVVKMRFAPHETVVLLSDGGTHAGQAWVLLRAAGHERVYFLKGGRREWDEYFGRTPAAGGERGGC